MAGTTLGYMKFVLGFDTIAFRKGMTDAEKDLVRLQKKIEKFGKGMADIGAKMSIGLTAPLVAFAAVGVKEALETADAMAQVENGIRSMGGASLKTATELSALADEMEMHSLYEADEILRSVSTNLLTFKNIAGPTFDRTQQVVVDLATKMRTDLQSAALLVGKALNDPIKGMAGLGRAGIQLDPIQKKLIKNLVETGQVAKAQELILRELETEFSGSAQAAQDVDPYNKLSDAFKNLAESVGVKLVPMLAKVADTAVSLVKGFNSLSPATQNLAFAFLAVLAAVGPTLYVVGNFIKLMAASKTVALFANGLLGLATAEGIAASGAVALGAAINTMLLPLGLATLAVGSLWLAFANWNKITNIVAGVHQAVRNYLGPTLTTALENLLWPIRAVYGAFKSLMNLMGAGQKKEAKNTYMSDVGASFARLNMEMKDAAVPAEKAAGGIAKVGKAAKEAKPAVDQLKEAGKQLYAELYPEQTKVLKFDEDIKALKALKLNAEETADAIERLNQRQRDAEGEARQAGAEKGRGLQDEPIGVIEGYDAGTTPLGGLDDVAPEMDKIKVYNDKVMTQIGDMTHKKAIEMAESWGQLAKDAIGSMKGMVDAFKSGDILGGIQLLLDTILKVVKALQGLGYLGGGGGGVGASGTAATFGGARAMGGPVVPGKTYLVGENGPEFFSSKRSGFISPNAKNSQPQRVVVVPSPYFDIVVDHRAANVAAPMAGQAAVMGVVGSEARMARRSRRNILAA